MGESVGTTLAMPSLIPHYVPGNAGNESQALTSQKHGNQQGHPFKGQQSLLGYLGRVVEYFPLTYSSMYLSLPPAGSPFMSPSHPKAAEGG